MGIYRKEPGKLYRKNSNKSFVHIHLRGTDKGWMLLRKREWDCFEAGLKSFLARAGAPALDLEAFVA